ncbi:MAG: peptide chain release factor-like protein, partial [Arenibacter sp.]
MNREGIIQELKFKAVRSSGAGGQHVNKVSSKVELT